MNKWTPLVLAALLALPVAAGATSVGLGLFGGSNISIIQDDNKGGTMFGARVPVKVISFLTLEPFFATSSGGVRSDVFGGITYKRTGFDVKQFGVNAMLGSPVGGAGPKFITFGGIGKSKLTRVGSVDVDESSYSFGLGLGAGVSEDASVLVRGDMNMVKTGETSRKFAGASLNVYYNLIRSK